MDTDWGPLQNIFNNPSASNFTATVKLYIRRIVRVAEDEVTWESSRR